MISFLLFYASAIALTLTLLENELNVKPEIPNYCLTTFNVKLKYSSPSYIFSENICKK